MPPPPSPAAAATRAAGPDANADATAAAAAAEEQDESPRRPVDLVVVDLDGLVLDTETLCMQVAAEVLGRRGAAMTALAQRAALGKRPLEAWDATVQALGLAACTGAELYAESEPLLSARWGEARPMPGAVRLLEHLERLGVPVAVATSTPRASFERKLEGKPELRRLLTRAGGGGSVACGDEVARGKPAPDVFELAVARLLRHAAASSPRGAAAAGAAAETAARGAAAADVDDAADDDDDDGGRSFLPAAREALKQGRVAIFEDAPAGAEGALAAGARVVLVPSMRDPSAYPCASLLAADVPSLLAFDPRCLGLAPFDDLVPSSSCPPPSRPAGVAAALPPAAALLPSPRGAVPLSPPLYLKGAVVRGFGRGSRELGVPTANVDPDALVTELAEAVTGVYVGWASVGDPPRVAVSGGGVGGDGDGDEQGDEEVVGAATRPRLPRGVYPTALSIGFNPQYANSNRTCEPWILANFGPGVEFYGEEIRLLVTGYLRPEAKFESVAVLAAQIRADARDARRALADPRFLAHAGDAFLSPSEK